MTEAKLDVSARAGVRGARPAWTEGIGLVDTGTPPGVGMGLRPQVWLRPGDVMELGIDGSAGSVSAW